MPGFAEGHSHLMAGAMWRYPYAGYHDCLDPTGRLTAYNLTRMPKLLAQEATA